MRTRLIVAAMTLAVCTQPTSVSARKASHSAFARPALEPGAVYEADVRVSPSDLEEYMSYYAKWLLPVDMAPNSGRKLLTVLSREIGDDHNLVFLYWYESRYKEQYYCNYAREFFAYHLKNTETQAELKAIYEKAAQLMQLLGEHVANSGTIDEQLCDCRRNEVPPVLAETIRRVEEPLRKLTVSEEDSWNFGVNPCRVQKIRDAERNRGPFTPSVLDTCERSLLEEMVSHLQGGRGSGEEERK